MKYDVVILGSSINGMVSAAYIAKQGLKVGIVDKADFVGGLCGSRELNINGKTRKTRGVLQDTSSFSKQVFKDLGLDALGCKRKQEHISVPINDKDRLLIGEPTEKVMTRINTICPEEQESYKNFFEFIHLYKAMIQKVMTNELPNVASLNISTAWNIGGLGLSLRTKGKRAMNELLRSVPMCSADFLNERFKYEPLKAGLAVPSITGNLLGPWSPASNALLLSYYGLAGDAIIGGPSQLSSILQKKCESLGVDFMLGNGVKTIKTEKNKVVSLLMNDGNEMPIKAVMSALDVKTTFLKKLDKCAFKLRKRIENFRMRGTTAHIDFFLNDQSLSHFDNDESVTRMHLCESIDGLEKSFDPIKYKELPSKPLIELSYSKENNHISALVHFVPQELKVGWNDESKNTLSKTVVQSIQQYVPGFSDCIESSHVMSPGDIERDYELWGGQIQYGEFGLDQAIMRPVPELVDNTTPFENLFLCSESQHPGGFVSGVASRIASQKLLKKKIAIRKKVDYTF